ncbi:uncharacterized protein ACNLHF_019799 isoform 1-T1 [Anomaloglossus baeobatrachus]
MSRTIQKAFYRAVSTIRSAGVKCRLDKINKLENKRMKYRENILLIEEDIFILANHIRKETIKLEKVDLTLEDVTVTEFLHKTELICKEITTMKNAKQKLINRWEKMMQELNSVDKTLWSLRIPSDPWAMDQTTEDEMEKNGCKTRLQRCVSGICCVSNN